MHSTCIQRTGTTLCHPKIGYVDPTRNPALDTLALNSPPGHFNGDQRTPSLHQTDKNHGDSKAQSLTRPTTHAAISTFSTCHNSISSQYSQPFTSLAAQKQTQYSMLQIKPYSKNTFRLSPSYFFIIQPFFTLQT